MNPKKVLAYIRDYEQPAQSRHYVMMTALAFITLEIILVWDIIIGESRLKLLGLAGILIAMLLVQVWALKTGHLQQAAIIVSIAIVIVCIAFFKKKKWL